MPNATSFWAIAHKVATALIVAGTIAGVNLFHRVGVIEIGQGDMAGLLRQIVDMHTTQDDLVTRIRVIESNRFTDKDATALKDSILSDRPPKYLLDDLAEIKSMLREAQGERAAIRERLAALEVLDK